MTKFVHSRWLLLVTVALMAAGIIFAWRGAVPSDLIAGDRGLLLPSANLWLGTDPAVGAAINIAVTVGLAALMILLNNTFNLMRATTLLDATLFLLATAAMPALLLQLYSGTVICLTVTLCLFLLFSCYGNPRPERRVLLIFATLSFMTMTQYAYLAYIAVFAVGCAQMRILSPRSVIAALLGLAVPWWMAFGTGLAWPAQMHYPDFMDLAGTVDFTANLPLYVTLGFTALLLVVAWCLNFPQMISYNAHLRAYNGTASVLALVTIVAMVVDFTNMQAYAPVLAMCAAFQMGRVLAVKGAKSRRGYIPVLIILLIYILLYLWNVLK